tara:strand:+ start:2978 stop:4108 length:1131 start_codon:yes stop_codon:yes gene_type:complete
LPIIKEITNSNFGWDFELVGDKKTAAGIKGIDPSLAKESIAQGGLNWTFTPLINLCGGKLPLSWQHGLIKRLLKRDYNAVIMLGSVYYLTYWLVIPLLKAFQIPIIFWTHGFLGKDSRLMAGVRHLMYVQANSLLLYGEKAKQIMDSSGLYKGKKLYVIYNSLDYSALNSIDFSCKERDALRKELYFHNELPLVVASGRVNKSKRFDKLIEALDLSIKEYGMLFNLLIIGDGPELKKLKEMARDRKIEQYINFVGAKYGVEAYRFLIASDLSVIPGNVGLSAMHAMSAGLPVISHNEFSVQMPEHEAIIEGKTGSFYKNKDTYDLMKKIHLWAYNPRLLRDAKACCKAIVKSKYSVDYQREIIKDCLLSLDNEQKN